MAIRDPERYFDRRTVKRHIKRGHVSDQEFKSFVAELPDVSDQIMDKEEGGDDDGFEARFSSPPQAEAEAEAETEGEGEAEAARETSTAPAPTDEA
jgi:hypothetical protein